MKPITLIATAAFGLESQVAYELKKLGYEDQAVEGGRVVFKGDELAIARSNLWLRTADRVQLRLGEFSAKTFDELYDQVRALPWTDWLPKDAEFPVDGKSVKSQLSSVPAVQGVVKKAIVDAMAAKYKVQQLPETGARYKILVSLLNDVATLTIDTSGDGLHKRGYRPIVAAAPLKETMAAGLITLARWFPDRPFADPFCGSGTLPIEAALIALNIAPGKFRHFDSEQWGAISQDTWRKARKEALELEQPFNEVDIYGSDIDPAAIQLAERHAYTAMISKKVRFECKPVKAFHRDSEYGFMITNPPYGERLGEMPDVEELEIQLGEAMASMPTWGSFVITSHEQFERFFGKPAFKKRKLYNGRLRCDLYQYPGPRRPRPEGAESRPPVRK